MIRSRIATGTREFAGRATAALALLFSGPSACGGSTPPPVEPPPAEVATSSTDSTSTGPDGLDTSAVRLLPSDVDVVMRVHLAPVRGTVFEQVVLERFPLGSPGKERDLQIDILARTEAVTIGLGEETVGWVLEGDLGPSFDGVVALFADRGAPPVRGEPGQRTLGDERVVVAERERMVTLHMPAAAADGAGEVPPAVSSTAIRELRALLPDVPPDREAVFEAWLAPTWDLFRDLELAARVSYGAASNDLHIDAALRYPDPELAAARASDWAEFWEGFAEESPESFDRDSATIRSEGATLVLHHELGALSGEPGATERVIMWTLVSLAVHQPPMDFR